MKVLIAGCGYVGTALALRLSSGGHQVWGLRRRPAALPAPVHPLSADLTVPGLPGPDGDTRLPSVDVVVFALAPDESSPDAYRTTYVKGLSNLLAAVELPERPQRLIFVSSTSVWGDRGGDWVDEETEPAPDDFRGAILLEAEDAARSAGIPAVVLRFGGIYGPGRDRLIRLVRSGEATCPEGEPIWSNRIHRDDAAAAIAHLAELPEPEATYIGVDDEPARLCEVYRFVADLLDVSPPDPGAGGRRRASKRCSNARLRASGYEFLFPTYREGYRAMLSEGVGD